METNKFYSAKLGAIKVLAYARTFLPSKLLFLTTGPFGWIISIFLTARFNQLINKGVEIAKICYINVDVNTDMKTLNEAISKAYAEIKLNPPKTKEEMDAIDDKVISAMRELVIFSKLRER